MNDLRVWLDSLDGPLVAATIIGLFILLCIVCAAYDAVQRQRARVSGPRRESHSERAHRIDAEASRAVHSGRKAGRTAVR